MKKLLQQTFKAAAVIEISPETPAKSDDAKPKTITVDDPNDQFNGDGSPQSMVVFEKDDPVTGKVTIKPEKRFEHAGIKIELIGEIVMYYETKETTQFTSLSKDLAPAGFIGEEQQFTFSFKNVEKEYESYRGINVDVRYYLRVTIIRNMAFNIVKEQEIWVHCQHLLTDTSEDKGIHMEVGLEEVVLLSIKYERTRYELTSDVIKGRLEFFLVNVKIDRAEVGIVKKETIGQGEEQLTESETLHKFEIIDGTPVKGEVVPVRLYLGAIDPWKLTPSSDNINNKFGVKYFLHLTLCDVLGRRFFKQREIVLWRK